MPVSSRSGIGEYMRSLTIAEALTKRWPGKFQITFLINRHVDYAKHCPFDTVLLDNSATKDSKLVLAALARLKPALTIFDCAGRAPQIQLAKKLGSAVIYFSQHKRKRARGQTCVLRRAFFFLFGIPTPKDIIFSVLYMFSDPK